MASIMGFTMKGIKEPLGREGYGCIGTMYLDGTKIGTYTDYGDGACEQVEYTCPKHREAMMKVVIAYAKEHPDEFIVNLYKQRPHQKNGYRAISVKDNEITAYPQSWTDEQIKKMAAGAELFFSLQDFVK